MNDFLKKIFEEYSISYFTTIIITFMLNIFSPLIVYVPYLIVKTIFFNIINHTNNLEEITNYDVSSAMVGLTIYVLLIKLLTLKNSYFLYFHKNFFIILFNLLIYISFYFISYYFIKTNIKFDCCLILSLFQ